MATNTPEANQATGTDGGTDTSRPAPEGWFECDDCGGLMPADFEGCLFCRVAEVAR